MNKTLQLLLAVCLLAVVLFLPPPGEAAGQAPPPDDGWTPPFTVFTEGTNEYTNELWLLRDPADMLYLWWPVFPAEGDYLSLAEIRNTSAVFHAVWQEGVWEKPRDVLVWPNAGNNLLSAVIDSQGTIHAFSHTDCLSYTSVSQKVSMDPKAWRKRTCVDGMGVSNIAVTIDREDRIYLAYSAEGSQAIRVAVSENGGIAWDSVEVATTAAYDGPANGFFTDPDISVDERGRIHVVWSPASPPSGYPLLGVLYARSDDSGKTWTSPVQVGQDREGQPALVTHNDDVHVLWNGDASKRGRYYRYSSDGGTTWQPIEQLGEGGGLQRKPALIVDNRGNVHAVLHEQENLFYIAKVDNQWTAKQPLYSPQDRKAQEVFTIRLAITGGNRLHALYTLMSAENPAGRAIYHQERLIDAAPATPTSRSTPLAASLALPTVTQVATVGSVPAAVNTPSPRPVLQTQQPATAPEALSLGLALTLSAVTVGAALTAVFLRRRR